MVTEQSRSSESSEFQFDSIDGFNVTSRKVTLAENKFLQDLLFGKDSNTRFIAEWTQQPLEFRKDVKFALEQRGEGPCGVIAALNAFIVKQILWSGGRTSRDNLLPQLFNMSDYAVHCALVLAIQEIIMQAATGYPLYTKRHSKGPFIYVTGKVDTTGETQFTTMDVYTLETGAELLCFLVQNLHEVMDSGPISVVVSALLCHGESVTKAELSDLSSALMYSLNNNRMDAMMDLVRFLLIGRHFVFPPEIFEYEYAHSAVGLMSEYDGANIAYHKDPYYPIWVFHHSDHFLVYYSESLEALEANQYELKDFVCVNSKSSNDSAKDIIRLVDKETLHRDGRFAKFILNRWPETHKRLTTTQSKLNSRRK